MQLKSKYDITQELLKENLRYDPLVGKFYRMKSFRSIKVGDEAGHYCPTRDSIKVGVCGKYYELHVLAWLYMTGEYPIGYEIDHIDHDRTNNKWGNLRKVTKAVNAKNLPKYASNSTGVTGISFRKDTGKWRARIMVDKQSINLGSFSSFEDAVKAREDALLEHGFHTNHGK